MENLKYNFLSIVWKWRVGSSTQDFYGVVIWNINGFLVWFDFVLVLFRFFFKIIICSFTGLFRKIFDWFIILYLEVKYFVNIW